MIAGHGQGMGREVATYKGIGTPAHAIVDLAHHGLPGDFL